MKTFLVYDNYISRYRSEKKTLEDIPINAMPDWIVCANSKIEVISELIMRLEKFYIGVGTVFNSDKFCPLIREIDTIKPMVISINKQITN